MVNCIQCQSAISRTRPAVFCSACKNQIHSSCLSASYDIPAVLASIPGMSWKCSQCIKDCVVVNQSRLEQLLECKVGESLSEFKKEIQRLTTEINKVPVSCLSNSVLPKYSDVLKSRAQPAIIVYPKNSEQPIAKSKAEILNNISLSEENIQLAKVKNVKDGGILISCKGKDQNDKIKSVIEQKMSHTYITKEVHGISPKIRIVGMSENYSNEQITTFLKSCNPDTFLRNTSYRILKISPLKKNNEVFQAVLQVDMDLYDRLMLTKNVFVGLDSCAVYDAVEVQRCFKCNKFNHTSGKCGNALSCPLCSGDHKLKDCNSDVRKCSNCVWLKNNSSLDISVDHIVWEKEKCTAYKNACDKLRSDLFGRR